MQYSELAEVYSKLEKTTKRLEKTHIIAELIKKTSPETIQEILLLLEGKVFPSYDERKIGVASKLILKAISLASGLSLREVEERWKKTGDLGTAALEIFQKKRQHTLGKCELSVKKVFSNIKKLAELEGEGSVEQKIKLIAELLTSSKPEEARYIVRTILEDLRVGIGESAIRDAIVWAFFSKELGISYDEGKKELIIPEGRRDEYNRYINLLQEAYDITNDYGEIANKIKTKGTKAIEEAELKPGRPVQVMLFKKAKDINDAFDIVGKPAAFEYKYDGFRVQIHKDEKKIALFTRRLENVTEQFPDIIEYVKKYVRGESFILDSEAVGLKPKTNQYLPFQSISQRIRRKYNISEMARDFPVEVNVFDILYYNGKSTISMPFNERRALICRIIEPIERKILPSRLIIAKTREEAEKFYQEALDRGNEGIMGKNLSAVYKPGSRVGYGVKIKPTMESLDLAIVAAEWGEGKRAKMLTSYTLACRDGDKLLEVGKVSTGLKELEEEGTSFKEMTDILKPLIIEEKGRTAVVKPKVVIEVKYEEIQKSPSYSSGYALRFPRFIRLRDDKSIKDIDTLKTIQGLFAGQKKRKS
ncbi:MAG: ATP-dependent DNA ligase [Candidatus Woesearchaeota archaeon]